MVLFWRERIQKSFIPYPTGKFIWIFGFSSVCLAYLIFASNYLSQCLSVMLHFVDSGYLIHWRWIKRRRALKLILIFWLSCWRANRTSILVNSCVPYHSYFALRCWINKVKLPLVKISGWDHLTFWILVSWSLDPLIRVCLSQSSFCFCWAPPDPFLYGC